MRKTGIIAVLAFTLFSLQALALTLPEARQQGRVGETQGGYLAAIAQDSETLALVKKINEARSQRYQQLAQSNNLPSQEVARLAGKKLETLEELTAEGRRLLERGIERVVISLGGRGALYLRKGSTIYAEGLKVPVGSTVGAGDSVVAALAYAEAQGLSEEEAVRLSTAAGAANVMCSGTQAAEREAVEALLPKVRFSRLRP